MESTLKLITAGLGAAAAYGLYRRRRKHQLDGQTALITGASRGLGLSMAREYARRGCRVVICARDVDRLETARNHLQQDGAEVLAVSCDVSDRRHVDDLVDQTISEFGAIDILVNNAGVIQVGPVESTTLEDFDQALETMFYGTLLPTRTVIPQMMERGGGRIVNITSIGGRLSFPHLLPYTCAKFAAVGLSRGLHAELQRHNISVTTVVPGLMRTGSYFHAIFKGNRTGEFTWFSLGSSLPGITVSARRAARRIVDASRKRKAEYIVGTPAKLGALFAGVFPGLTTDLLGKVNRLMLPAPQGNRRTSQHGRSVSADIEPPLETLLNTGTALGRRAARRLNQL